MSHAGFVQSIDKQLGDYLEKSFAQHDRIIKHLQAENAYLRKSPTNDATRIQHDAANETMNLNPCTMSFHLSPRLPAPFSASESLNAGKNTSIKSRGVPNSPLSTSLPMRESCDSRQSRIIEIATSKVEQLAHVSRAATLNTMDVDAPEELETVHSFTMRHPWRLTLRRIVSAPRFDMFFGLFVVLSAMLLGVETELEARRGKRLEMPCFFFAQLVCLAALCVETTLRLIAHGERFFGFGGGHDTKYWKWNVFDCVCIATMSLDLMFNRMESDVSSHSRLLRVFRLLRVMRALRLLRAIRFADEFRKMAYALQYSTHTLFWAVVALAFELYLFAVAFTKSTVDEMMDSQGMDEEKKKRMQRLRARFGNIPLSIRTLYESISGGIDWKEAVDSLETLHWVNSGLFYIFIVVTSLGVLNVITSVFVESAVASYDHYKDLLLQKNMKQKKLYLEHLREIFEEIDEDQSNEITLEELNVFISNPTLEQYLESIDIQPEDAQTLFHLLDKDANGRVGIDEFCAGCLQLKGDAKSFDIHCLMYESQRMVHKWHILQQYLEDEFLPALTEEFERLLDAYFARWDLSATKRMSAIGKINEREIVEESSFLFDNAEILDSALTQVLREDFSEVELRELEPTANKGSQPLALSAPQTQKNINWKVVRCHECHRRVARKVTMVPLAERLPLCFTMSAQQDNGSEVRAPGGAGDELVNIS